MPARHAPHLPRRSGRGRAPPGPPRIIAAMTTAQHHIAARLALADGSVFHGRAFGDLTPKTIAGEVCFNTAMSGYQEILTDPSYAGQIVTMTCPQIGNYGTNSADLESAGVHPLGFVVRELSSRMSNFRAEQALAGWLADHGVTGITGVDTRALTRMLRVQGALNGVLCTEDVADEALVSLARRSPGLVGRNLVAGVSTSAASTWHEDLGQWSPIQGEVPPAREGPHVVAIDCGAKYNIFRNLADRGCSVSVVPWDTPAARIGDLKPDGLFVSNGPGDPSAVHATIETLRELRGRVPIFGICLGHQLLSLALGATTYKLKFGHRGANHPVQNLFTGKVEITSQNHGFAVDTRSLEKAGGSATHINLNDRTLEGFRLEHEPVFAVQYHPEASPGPHDARYLFDCFLDMLRTGVSPSGDQMDAAQRRRNRVGSPA